MQEVYCSEPLSVGRNTLLIPVETVLTLASQIAGSVVKLVNINQSVALGHFSGGKRHEINAAPWGILLFTPKHSRKPLGFRGTSYLAFTAELQFSALCLYFS